MSDFLSDDLLRHARAECDLMPRGSHLNMHAIALCFPYVVSWQRPHGADDYSWGYTLCGSLAEAESCAAMASMNDGGATVYKTIAIEDEENARWVIRENHEEGQKAAFIDGEPDDRCWFALFRGEG